MSPAKRGNRNSLKNGTHSYFTTGRLPKGGSYVARIVRELSAALKAAVTEQHGECSLWHGAMIQTAARHEAAALLKQRWLREADDPEKKLSIIDKCSILDGIGRASDSRDRCLKLLGLDQRHVAETLEEVHTPAGKAAGDEPTALEQAIEATADGAATQ